MDTTPSTEPVTDGAKVVAAVVAAVGAAVLILTIVGTLTADKASGVMGAVTILATSALTLVGIITPIIKARAVRELVVPAHTVAVQAVGSILVAGPAADLPIGQPVDVISSADLTPDPDVP